MASNMLFRSSPTRPVRVQEHASCSYAAPRRLGHRTCNVLPSRLACRMKASQNWEEMYDNLFSSTVFRSEVVVREFTNLMKENTTLAGMASKFPDFDLAGKRMYLDQMEQVSDRYEIFIKRLELSQDPGAKEFLRHTNAQMLEGGFTYRELFAGMRRSVEEYRKWVAMEEQASSNPEAHQAYLKELRSMWNSTMVGKVDWRYLVERVDPKIVLNAQNDPKFWIAIREISTDTSPAVMAKWLDDPNIGPMIAEMWKAMQSRS